MTNTTTALVTIKVKADTRKRLKMLAAVMDKTMLDACEEAVKAMCEKKQIAVADNGSAKFRS